MAKGKPGRPREDGLDSLEAIFEEQFHRIFSSLWVTLPAGGKQHVSINERKLREDKAARLSEALGEDYDTQENRK
jgi:hypothetical protein